MFLDRCFEENKMDNNMKMDNQCCPVYECPKENVVNREIYYDVPQECPFM